MRVISFFRIACVLSLGVSTSFASLTAFDSAADGTYNDGWQTGDNGGFGFGAWTLTLSSGNGAENGHFVATSTANSLPDDGVTGGLAADSDIDTLIPDNRSWGMYANTGQTADAFRPFTGALVVGDVFNLDWDNGNVSDAPLGTVGIAIQNSSGENLFEALFIGGNTFYTVNDLAGVTATTVPFGNEGLNFTFSLTSASAYRATLTRRDGITDTVSGSLLTPGGGQAATQVRLFNFNAGAGAPANDYYNSMRITAVPEPHSATLLGVSLLALLAFRRRRG